MIIKKLTTLSLIVGLTLCIIWGSFSLAQNKLTNTQSSPHPLYNSGEFFFPPYLSDSDRMGFGLASTHDTAILNAGWYLDWRAKNNPPHPAGAEYAYTLYLNTHNTGTGCNNAPLPATEHNQVTPSYTGTALINKINDNVGKLWLVGNEPDSLYNGNPIQAELYAELYHHFYTTIKATDPTAKVAIAAVVQPSPLRMAYLDKILAHYQSTYGTALPTDLWNIHLYALREVDCDFGASIPPFSDSNGWDYYLDESKDVDLMEDNIRGFRQWMYDRGYNNIPLIVTEFGILWPSSYPGFSNAQVAQYLNGMFDRLLNLTDATTGYPADGNRLVQLWAWYSTYDTQYGGSLYESSNSNNLTVIGDAFVAQTQTHHNQYVDLQPVPPISLITTSTTLSISAYLQNRGNTAATDAMVNIALVKQDDGTSIAEEGLMVGQVGSRYTNPSPSLQHTWAVTFSGTPTVTMPYSVNVTVTSSDDYSTNNQLSYATTWWQIADLAIIDISFSQSPYFIYQNPISMVVTATVANSGVWSTSQTELQFSLQTPDKQTHPLNQGTVPPLAIAESVMLTTTVSITQVGNFQLSAAIAPLNNQADLSYNNYKTQTIVAATSQVFLPMVLK